MTLRDHRPVQRLTGESLRGTAITPVVCPLPSVVALIGCALSDGERTGPMAPLRRRLLAHLRERDVAALLPLRTGERRDGSGGRPNEIVPIIPGASIDEQLDVVRATDPDVLAAGIAAATEAGHPTGPWRTAVGAHPARWLAAYVGGVRRAWEVLAPVWRRSSDLLDRDVERAAVAVAHDAAGELLAQVFPFSAVRGDDLLLPSHSPRSGVVRAGSRLVLVPLIAPAGSCGWTDDYGDRCLAVRYSAPAARRALDASPASLTALLGEPRARILRRLDATATAGELADLLHGAPSMVTHHLDVLEQAGLVTRTRDGRHVRVRRTARGTRLVELYEES